jgi:hypothetical protein
MKISSGILIHLLGLTRRLSALWQELKTGGPVIPVQRSKQQRKRERVVEL